MSCGMPVTDVGLFEMAQERIAHEFLLDWPVKQKFYDRVAARASDICKDWLQAHACKAIVTHRAKDAKSIQHSIRSRRHKYNKAYADSRDIKKDIVDLAGVRIALYFSDELNTVQEGLQQIFPQASGVPRPVRHFPDPSRPGERRSGSYKATHLKVTLPEIYNAIHIESEYLGVTVEIQITTLLMHAWSELEHDLVYKPKSGVVNLTLDEFRSLELLNGLVLSAEVAMLQLKNVYLRESGQSGDQFKGLSELAAWLKQNPPICFRGDVETAAMKHLKLLWKALSGSSWDRPGKLRQLLSTIDDRVRAAPPDFISHQANRLLTHDLSSFAMVSLAAEFPTDHWVRLVVEEWHEDLTSLFQSTDSTSLGIPKSTVTVETTQR